MKIKNDKVYYYTVYGLKIKSSILLEELTKIDSDDKEDIDINICFGEVDDDIRKSMSQGRVKNYEKGYVWFSVKDVAIYKIHEGKDIIIKPYENSFIEDIKLYLLGTCLGISLIEKYNLAIHGGSIKIGDRGIIFMGDKGAGKSTLTSALRLKGYELIADDISVIDENHKIKPGYPKQKLCEDAVDKLGYNKENFETIMVDDKIKYIIPADNNFINSPIKLGGIYYLSVKDIENVVIEEIEGKEKLDLLMCNIYRLEIVKMLGINNEYFMKCLSVAKNIPMYKIIRPIDTFSVNDQVSLIEDMFLKV